LHRCCLESLQVFVGILLKNGDPFALLTSRPFRVEKMIKTGSSSSLRPSSTLRQVLASPLYRGATLAMFLAGVGTSCAAPQIVLFLVKELGAPLPVAGLYYLTSLAAPLVGYLVGRRSDRIGERLGLFRLSALAGFFGWLGIAFSTQVWMPFLISSVFLALAGAAAPQLFAAVRDNLDQNPQASSETVISIVRMALTAGWIVGPVIGAWVATATSLRVTLCLTALCSLAQIIPMGTLKQQRVRRSAAAGVDFKVVPRFCGRAIWSLLAFTSLYVLATAGESVKYGFLPLYMDERLHLQPAVRGAVIGIQPLIELAIMPFSVMLARRIGLLWLMGIGALFGTVANICFATTSSAAGMFVGQILMGVLWGIFASLGIIAAQRLLPTAVATASAIFMSSYSVSGALGGLTGGLGVGLIGLPNVFFIPAAFASLAALGLVAMAKSGVLKGRSAQPVQYVPETTF
jgi:MFS transporter, SET family, sugar efflux transporter